MMRASSSDEYTRIEGLTTQLISDLDSGPTTYDSTVYGEYEMAESSSFNSSFSFGRSHGEKKRKKETGRNVKKYFRRCDSCCGPVQPNRFREFMWGIFSSRASKYGSVTNYWPSKLFEISIILLILSNVAFSVLLTDPEYKKNHDFVKFCEWFEVTSFWIFLVEYLLRFWSCVESPRYPGSCSGRVMWFLRPLSLLDLSVLVAFCVDMIANVILVDEKRAGEDPFAKADRKYIVAVRLLRMVSILRIERQSKGMKRLGAVLRTKVPELFITIFVAAMILILSATMMYSIERETFRTMGEGLWWASQAVTTVGYGDLTPKTMGGKIVAVITSFFGVFLFALPASVLGSGLMEIIARKKAEDRMRRLNNTVRDSVMGPAKLRELDKLGRPPKFSEIFDPDHVEHIKVAAELLSDAGYNEDTKNLLKQYTPEEGGYVGLHAAISHHLAMRYLKTYFEEHDVH